MTSAGPFFSQRAPLVRAVGAGDLADRLDRALTDDVKLLALTIDERAIILDWLDDPPDGLAELRAVFLNEHEWRTREGLDSSLPPTSGTCPRQERSQAPGSRDLPRRRP